MRRSARTLWLALPLVAVVACGDEPAADAPAAAGSEPAPQAEADPAAARTEIEAVNRQAEAALSSGDVPAFVQAYAEDARILPPNMSPVDGRQGIERFWTGGVQQLGIGAVQFTTDEVEVFGEAAYEQGRYEFTTDQGPAQGKYLTIWRRTPEGWRWQRHIWNPGPA